MNLAFAAFGMLAPQRLSSQLLAWLRCRLTLDLLAVFDSAMGALVFAFLRLAFIFAAGTLVFASLRLPSSSLSAPWSSLLFACLRLRLSRWASRRPCRWIRMDRGPSVDGQRWHPQQYPTSCVVVCIPSGIVRYFGGVPAHPYKVWGTGLHGNSSRVLLGS